MPVLQTSSSTADRSGPPARLDPIMNGAKTLKCHLRGLVVDMKRRITNIAAEGANGRACRCFTQYCIAILLHCGGLDLYS
ncbi:MAG: hypothetical protein M0Z84_13570 [Gammaproteobacteria bacterium]|nr:hypothetical protein [Gammaproteobacteria bacterium]